MGLVVGLFFGWAFWLDLLTVVGWRARVRARKSVCEPRTVIKVRYVNRSRGPPALPPKLSGSCENRLSSPLFAGPSQYQLMLLCIFSSDNILSRAWAGFRLSKSLTLIKVPPHKDSH